MADDNTWFLQIEKIVTSKMRSALAEKYPSINVTNIGTTSAKPVFPTVYIHALGGSELGQTLDGKSVNGYRSTIQIEVSSLSRSECLEVTEKVVSVAKTMRFEVYDGPEIEDESQKHRNIVRIRRTIGASDSL